MIDQQQLEAALPSIAKSGLPLLVARELAGPIDAAIAGLHDAIGEATPPILRRGQIKQSSKPSG